jgi:hypothetical protein
MANILTTGTRIQVATAASVTDTTDWNTVSVIPALMGSTVEPNTDSLTRETMNGSLMDCPNVAGNESTNVPIKLELGLVEGSKFTGHEFYEQGLGVFLPNTGEISNTTTTAVVGEAVSIPAVGGTITLANQNLSENSGVIIQIGGAAAGEMGTDYTIDYNDGIITIQSDVNLPEGAPAATVNYSYNTGVATTSKIVTTTGTTFGLYKVGVPTTSPYYLNVRETVDGAGDSNIETISKGTVVDSITFNLATGQIATVDFSAKGTGYTLDSGAPVTIPADSVSCEDGIFVVKNAVVNFGNPATDKSLDVRDITITVNNEVTERNAAGSDGISERIITKKSIEVSFSMDIEDMSEFTSYQNNAQASMFIQLENEQTNDIVAFYMPNLRRTQVSKSDDGNIIAQSLTLQAYNLSTKDDALYIAVQK